MSPPKPIPDFNPAQIRLFWMNVKIGEPDDCWEWQGATNGTGYGKLKRNSKYHLAHRVAYTLNHGDPGKLLVCHTCDNRNCCNPQHLFKGTQSDNLFDMSARGRRVPPPLEAIPRGIGHYKSKLTENQVHQIRNGEIGKKEASKKFGVSLATIYDAFAHRTWKHLV